MAEPSQDFFLYNFSMALTNLILGVLWVLLWLGKLIFFQFPHRSYLEGSLEFLIASPLGIAFIYDWIAFERKKLPNFLEQTHWNFSDYSFFCTGGIGFLALLFYTLSPRGTIELKTMGFIGLAIGVIHWVRRRFRMEKKH